MSDNDLVNITLSRADAELLLEQDLRQVIRGPARPQAVELVAEAVRKIKGGTSPPAFFVARRLIAVATALGYYVLSSRRGPVRYVPQGDRSES